MEAIRTLRRIEGEGRLATSEEQEVLAQYVGWGGLPQVFDEKNESWGKEYAELKDLLSEEEYTAARASTLNAHYTSPTVVIGHSQFEKRPLSPERQARFVEEQIREITQGIEELKEERGERWTIKQMEKSKKDLEAKLTKLQAQEKKDDVVTFEELGVDRMFVDEAHNYKNLFLYTKMRNVAGISQTEAQKSSDMYMKCRYMDELTGNKGVVFATGTPISNSMTEQAAQAPPFRAGVSR